LRVGGPPAVGSVSDERSNPRRVRCFGDGEPAHAQSRTPICWSSTSALCAQTPQLAAWEKKGVIRRKGAVVEVLDIKAPRAARDL
jgi:hypothetical protein